MVQNVFAVKLPFKTDHFFDRCGKTYISLLLATITTVFMSPESDISGINMSTKQNTPPNNNTYNIT